MFYPAISDASVQLNRKVTRTLHKEQIAELSLPTESNTGGVTINISENSFAPTRITTKGM